MATEIIKQPKADWAPLMHGPFYYGTGSYISSTEKWLDALHTEVEHIPSIDPSLPYAPLFLNRSGHSLAAQSINRL
jgi:hypothetical protein